MSRANLLVPSLLRKESTFTVCNNFTTIFDDDQVDLQDCLFGQTLAVGAECLHDDQPLSEPIIKAILASTTLSTTPPITITTTSVTTTTTSTTTTTPDPSSSSSSSSSSSASPSAAVTSTVVTSSSPSGLPPPALLSPPSSPWLESDLVLPKSDSHVNIQLGVSPLDTIADDVYDSVYTPLSPTSRGPSSSPPTEGLLLMTASPSDLFGCFAPSSSVVHNHDHLLPLISSSSSAGQFASINPAIDLELMAVSMATVSNLIDDSSNSSTSDSDMVLDDPTEIKVDRAGSLPTLISLSSLSHSTNTAIKSFLKAPRVRKAKGAAPTAIQTRAQSSPSPSPSAPSRPFHHSPLTRKTESEGHDTKRSSPYQRRSTLAEKTVLHPLQESNSSIACGRSKRTTNTSRGSKVIGGAAEKSTPKQAHKPITIYPQRAQRKGAIKVNAKLTAEKPKAQEPARRTGRVAKTLSGAIFPIETEVDAPVNDNNENDADYEMKDNDPGNDDKGDCSINVKEEPSSITPNTAALGAEVISTSVDKRFLCSKCPGEFFGRVHDLKRHIISKHSETKWRCDFCHRDFVRADALLRHYTVKAARKDGVHPTLSEKARLEEAKARAKLMFKK